MPQPTPATISYDSKGNEQTIKFHTVISETHQATSQVTKFPVQNGFEVSNHAIRKNRVVAINGMFTNTVLKGTGMIQYSKQNTSKEMFKVMGDLVANRTQCRVVTNLGVYFPVIFTNFQTAQKQGMVDAIDFTMSGEEIQVAGVNIGSAPKQLTFEPVDRLTKEQLEEQWLASGLPYSTKAHYSQTDALLGTDFGIVSKDVSGQTTDTTFECVGYDDTTGLYSYLQHTSITDIFEDATNAVTDVIPPLPFELSGGLLGTSNCLLEGAASFVEDVTTNTATDLIKTAMGELRSSAYGALQDIVNLGGGPFGQSILGFTVDCVVSQAAQTVGFESTTAEGVVEEGIQSIQKKGEEILQGTSKGIRSFTTTPTTITQISTFEGPMATLGITN